MRCEYIVTYKDFLESVKPYRRLSKQALSGYWLYVWILPIAGGSLGLTLLSSYSRQGAETFNSAFWVGTISLAIAIGFPVRYWRGLRRAYKQRGTLVKDGKMVCEFDEQTIRFITPAGAEISYPWNTFTDYFENDSVAVLFVKEAAFHTIPKRAMDQDGWSEFRAIVHHHAGINHAD
jgi:YcxB-like protein